MRLLVGLVAFTAIAAAVPFCQVPVFRYALERWKPDAYEVRILSDGPLSEEQLALLEQLKPDPVSGSPVANFKVRIVDGTTEDTAKVIAGWKQAFPDAKLPQIVVDSPRLTDAGQHPIVWTAPLSQENLDQFVDSDVRQQISEELVDGTSAVWILVKSGNKPVDDAAEKQLSRRLAHNEKTMKLPTLDAEDLQEGFDQNKLKLKFAVVTVDRDSPDEAFLVKSLLSVEDDLQSEEFAGQPLAFPVFGRGRALWALVGSGIADDNIDEACGFLVGACSCQVKAQNPGADLLIALDWDALVETAFEPSDVKLPPLMGLSGFRKPKKDPTESVETSNPPGVVVERDDRAEVPGTGQASEQNTTGPADLQQADSSTPAPTSQANRNNVQLLLSVLAIGALGVVVLLVLISRR